MKAFTSLLILGCIAVCQSQVPKPHEIYEQTENSIYQIFSFSHDGSCLGFGSAVLIDSEGIITTNYHVINDASKLKIIAGSDTIVNVAYIGIDPDNDVALLKINPRGDVAVRIGDPSRLKPGMVVYALGNPKGLTKTFSSGIVSAVRKKDNEIRNCVIQYTASISPGSSGGALLNENGELVGITSLNFSGGQNLNFAVPITDFFSLSTVNASDSAQVMALTRLCSAYDFSEKKRKPYAESIDIVSCMDVLEDNATLSRYFGEYFADSGRFDEALKYYEKSLASNPGNAPVLKLLGDLYSHGGRDHKGDSIRALEYYSKAIELEPNNESYYYARGLFLEFRIKDYDGAMRDYETSSLLAPGTTYYKFRSAQVSLTVGDTTAAIRKLHESIDYENDVADVCYDRARMFEDLGYYKEAESQLSEAIRLGATGYDVYFLRAICYSKLNQPFAAIADYLECVKQYPRDPAAFNNLGFTYLDIPDYELAEKNFEKALSLDKNHFDSYLGLAILSFKQNNMFNARKFIRKGEKIENLISDGSKGLRQLEAKGYFWSREEKEILNSIFQAIGYPYDRTPKGKRNAKRAKV